MRQPIRPTVAVAAALTIALIQVISASPQGRLKMPTNQPRGRVAFTVLSDGAKLAFDAGDVTAGYTTSYLTPPSTASTKVKWDVSQVRGASAVIFEVSRSPFSPDRSPSNRPPAMVSSGRMEGKFGSTSVSVGKIATEVGYQSPDANPGTRRLSRPDRRLTYMANGGQFSIYLRVVPVASVANPTPVGLASPELRIIYAKSRPIAIKFAPPASNQPTKPSPVVCSSIRYTPFKQYCFVHPSPSVCAKFGQAKPWYEESFSFVLDAWDWTCETYQAAKKAVVDIAASALPFVPREAFEIALDGALAACGMPPNIPNLDQLMEHGADYLAGEIVSQIGPPAGGELAKEQIRKALVSGAKAAAKKVGNAGPDKPCQYNIDWSYMIVLIRNTSNQPIGPLYISSTDWTGILATNEWDGRLFKSFGQVISNLSPGATLPVYIPLMPHMHQKKHYVQGVHKESLYWNDYQTRQTEVVITVSSTYDPTVKTVSAKTGKRAFNQGFEVKF